MLGIPEFINLNGWDKQGAWRREKTHSNKGPRDETAHCLLR